MNDSIDLLQIKIEKAKSQLSKETLGAINAVDWRMAILKLKEKNGYSIEQLGDLETETELVLSGLLNPEDYPSELEKRMGLSKDQANELVKEMNEQVFKKIKDELIKNTERKTDFVKSEKNGEEIMKSAGIEILDEKASPTELQPREKLSQAEKLEIVGEVKAKPIFAEKLSMPVQSQTTKTEHTLDNISKTETPNTPNTGTDKPKTDPYREIPE